MKSGLMMMAVILGALLIGWGCVQAQPDPTPGGDSAGPEWSRWPMRVDTPDGQVTIFQPQLEDFQGETLSARAAVSVASARQGQQDQQAPTVGAIWFQSRVATDRVARTVRILDVNVTRTRFPNADPPAEQSLSQAIRQALTAQPITLSLDQMLTMLETVQKERAAASSLRTDPPAIIFRDHPAVKVQYDGAPKLMAAGDAGLMRVSNTPFFVVLDPPSKTYYLKGGGMWFGARDPMGPFQNVEQAPAAVAALADSSDYKDPQEPLTREQAAGIEIITATEPTELIWTDGEPQMATIAGTDLLYVTNTDSDLFLSINEQTLYVLLSGRWYVAPDRSGPWTYVPADKLPDDFRRIPPNSEKADVLAHVSGTQAAEDAVADTAVPQTATVDRKQFDQPVVDYDGEPQFEAVEGADCSYGVNTSSSVVLVGQDYYCCNDAVWYMSHGPRGPWDLCTRVPVEIYRLPPTCPIYPVRFVYVYGYTPDVVYVGYTPGYVGCYPYSGVVVYGTGYRYRPWWGRHYYPRPWTYGFAAHYNSYVGHWGFDFGLAGGGGGGRWIGTGPHAWGRSDPWFGYGGYRPVVVHQDVHVNIFREQYVARARHERGESVPVRQDVYRRNVYDRRNDVHWELGPGHQGPAEHGRAEPLRPGPERPRPEISPRREELRDNVFTDHDGNIYRRTVDGWEVRDKGKWRSEERPERSPDERRATNAAPPHDEAQPKPRDRADHGEHPDIMKEPPKDQPREKVREAPPKEAPRQVAKESKEKDVAPDSGRRPNPAKDTRDLNRDYRARVTANERLKNYERPSSGKPAESRGRSDAPDKGRGNSRADPKKDDSSSKQR